MRSLFLAGHTGLVGSALLRRWEGRAGLRVITAPRVRLDLADPAAVESFLLLERPESVVIAAGRVGGIQANASRPAEFIRDNLLIEAGLIHGSWKAGVKRLLNFGSGCMYPRECSQPMSPEHLMAGPMEPTSEPYSTAKLAGWVMCQAYNRQYGTRYVTAIPCTVYGPGDNFDLEAGHVVPALIRKFHEAKESGESRVTLWGTGDAQREFLYSDDLAEACEILLERQEGTGPINVGSQGAVRIRELASAVAEVTGFRGRVEWDPSRPEGAPMKRLDSAAMRATGWAPGTGLREGLEKTYRWFLQSKWCEVKI
jgi:GDP-L-fucose synthase